MKHVKRLGFLRKREDLTDEEFRQHWFSTHAVLCSKIPNLLRYSVNLLDRKRFPGFEYDGFSELWFVSEEAMIASLASPEGTTLLADLPNFTSYIHPIVSEETPILWP